jgi:hypothetical protein
MTVKFAVLTFIKFLANSWVSCFFAYKPVSYKTYWL